MKNKHKKVPTKKLQDNVSYLKNTNVAEALRVVEAVKDMPHVNKIKFILK